MKFEYKKKQLKLNLILGLAWFALSIASLVNSDNFNGFDYFSFIFAVLYLIIYFYQKSKKYLTMENGIIKQNWPLGKRINLSEIEKIRHFAGDLVLKIKKIELIINRQLIHENSLTDLEVKLKKLNVKWD